MPKKGEHLSLEAKAKLLSHNIGKVLSEETRRKMSESKRGKGNNHTEETREKTRDRMTGNTYRKGHEPPNKGKKGHLSEESIRRLSESHKGQRTWLGKRHSEESKKKMSNAHKGCKSPMKDARHSEEAKAKMSSARKGIASLRKGRKFGPLSEETRRRQSAARMGHKVSEETRKKLSVTLKGRKFSEEHCRKLKEARRYKVIPIKDTSIEVKIQNLLSSKGVIFEKHVPLLGQPDLFIEPNICIFCDGNYWHNRPERKERDIKVNAGLRSSGYIVIRLWEIDINKNINACWDSIRREIKCNA